MPGHGDCLYVRQLVGLVMVGVLSAACASSGTSPAASSTPTPTPRLVAGPAALFGGMAFDVGTGQMVFLDPSGSGTWTWDGIHDWKHVTSSGPSTGTYKMNSAPFGIAWDSNSGSVIAEIGDMPMPLGAPQPAPATWSWRAGGWTKLDGANTPAVMGGAVAAFPPKQQVIMFGGCCGVSGRYNTAKAGMWTWDGTSWTELHPAHMPPARWGEVMAYDPAISRTVMYGGMTMEPDHPALNDMWAWDGSDWGALPAPTLDMANLATQFAYGPDGRLVLTTGSESNTWTFDGATWKKLDVSTPDCIFCALSFDALRNVTVMVTNPNGTPGAADQVWTWNGIQWSERS
jgi:hypothetical protein